MITQTLVKFIQLQTERALFNARVLAQQTLNLERQFHTADRGFHRFAHVQHDHGLRKIVQQMLLIRLGHPGFQPVAGDAPASSRLIGHHIQCLLILGKLVIPFQCLDKAGCQIPGIASDIEGFGFFRQLPHQVLGGGMHQAAPIAARPGQAQLLFFHKVCELRFQFLLQGFQQLIGLHHAAEDAGRQAPGTQLLARALLLA